MAETISIESNRFGRIEVDPQNVLHFNGLPGFSQARRFVVVDHADTTSFSWLVSLDDPDLAFVIANPWHFFPGYDPAVGTRHLTALEITKPEQLETVVFASFHGRQVTLNLSAPILINRESMQGTQVIIDDPRYSTREEVPVADPAQASTAAQQSGVQATVE
ncbi:MAG: flagellar assembly protein FliW [Myxococcota bacterium]|jgi:flagellar assembly factor FliW|nr:flagellar assembly protein FliW [Myxococcota bacterium]